MAAELSQMELYWEIGKLVSDRPEKGAAVAAAVKAGLQDKPHMELSRHFERVMVY